MVGLMFLLVVFSTPSVPQQCSRPVRSIKGMYLSGHVMSNGNEDGVGDCLINCSLHPRCKSINFRFKDLLCELNEADRHTHPWDYGSREGHAYSDYPFKVTFKELYMTPLLLEAYASYIDNSSVITANQITFNAGSIKEALLLRIPLVKAGILKDGTPLTVEITVANDVSIGQSMDSDPRYGVSDGTSFIGIQTVDQMQYCCDNYLYPCRGVQGTSGDTLTNKDVFDKTSPSQVAKFYPDQFVFTFKLEKSWGSCFTAQGGGFTKMVNYTRQLLPSRGLSLEVYKMNIREKVGIKYMEVTVRKTDDY